jgi:7-cyano-7-deazaguanine synthase
MTNAVVLLSGGLDSTTTLAVAQRDGHAVHALTFRYGQRHRLEVDAARQIGQAAGIAGHAIIDVDLRAIGGSALTGDLPVPKDRAATDTSIPSTYVPARNTIFLSIALAYAEVLNAGDIYIGVNALDSSGYPDCRPEFIAAFQHMAGLATRAGVEGKPVRIRAPLVALDKAAIIRLGLSLGVDYVRTTSCYDPTAEGVACGHCDACRLRLKGFSEAGVQDPVRYRVHG